jgi:hypothetical protein
LVEGIYATIPLHPSIRTDPDFMAGKTKR